MTLPSAKNWRVKHALCFGSPAAHWGRGASVLIPAIAIAWSAFTTATHSIPPYAAQWRVSAPWTNGWMRPRGPSITAASQRCASVPVSRFTTRLSMWSRRSTCGRLRRRPRFAGKARASYPSRWSNRCLQASRPVRTPGLWMARANALCPRRLPPGPLCSALRFESSAAVDRNATPQLRTPSRASNSPPAADSWFIAEFADDAAQEAWSERRQSYHPPACRFPDSRRTFPWMGTVADAGVSRKSRASRCSSRR